MAAAVVMAVAASIRAMIVFQDFGMVYATMIPWMTKVATMPYMSISIMFFVRYSTLIHLDPEIQNPHQDRKAAGESADAGSDEKSPNHPDRKRIADEAFFVGRAEKIADKFR
jgi:hypothetical protein